MSYDVGALSQPRDLRTTRLDLLPLRREHAPEMFDVLADPELYEFTGGKPPASVGALARHYQNWETRRSPDGSELWLNWVVRVRERRELVGYVQATVAADHADLAWLIAKLWQRRGYASEAARAMLDWLAGLGVDELRACVKPTHTASQHIAERLGMRRSDQWIDGEEVWVAARLADRAGTNDGK